MKPKLLIFIDWFYPGYKAGGPLTSNVNLVDQLKDTFDIYVITSDRDYHSNLPYDSISSNVWVKIKGANVYYFSPEEQNFSCLKKIAQDVNADVWYINGIYSRFYSIYPLLINRMLHQPKVIVSSRGMLSPHAIRIGRFKKRIFLILMQIFGLYKNIIFHTTNDEEKGHVKSILGGSICAISIENLPKKQVLQFKQKKKQNGDLKLVSFARISPEKNTLYALQVLGGCKENIQFDLYGQINDIEYWNKCKALISILPSNIKVSYKGVVDPNEINGIYEDKHFLFMPTTGENFGHAIIESFSNGCPVIISDKTPWRHLLGQGIGWDISLSNPEEFTQVLDFCSLMGQDEFNLISSSSFNFAQKILSDELVNNKYINLFTLK